MLHQKSGIEYHLLTEQRLEETIEFVTDLFVHHEYLTRESGLTLKEFGVFARLYCEASLKHQLSIIAIDGSSKELVGFSINEDPMSTVAVDANQFYDISDHYKPFLGMLTALNEKCWNLERKANFSFHLYLLGVKPAHQGKKIGKTLVAVSEMVAKENGFSYVAVEATSPLTKPICENLGYENLGNIVYSQFEFAGVKPYAHVTDYDGPYLFVKKL